MREILFQGKMFNGEWIVGSLLISSGQTFIWTDELMDEFGVHPNSIGQYTGIDDRDGMRIFEGDLLERKFYEHEQGSEPPICVVGEVYCSEETDRHGCWLLRVWGKNGNSESITFDSSWLVIGNSYDHPRLPS